MKLQGILLAGLLCGACVGHAQAERNKVLVIGLDGFRADVYGHARTPHLDALVREGYLSGEGWTADTAVSGSGWASIITGVERDKHGVRDNRFEGSRFADHPEVFTHIERAKPGLRTAALLSWPALASHVPWGADVVFDGGYDDDRVLQKAQALLASKSSPDVMLVNFNEPDGSGHAGDYFDLDAPGYLQAIETADARIGALMRAIRQRPEARNENWLVVVATDHGGSRHHGENIPEHRKTLVGFSGKSVAALGVDPLRLAPRQVDIVPSVLAHLGLPQPNGLDGRRMLRPLAEPAAALGRNQLVNGDAEYSVGRLDRAYDSDVPGWRKGNGGQVVDYATHAWLPAPGARAGANLFIGRDAGQSLNTLTQRVPLQGALANARSFRLSADLGAAPGHRARVFVRFTGEGRVTGFTRDGVLHLFKGLGYWRYSLAEQRVLPGYPEPIRTAWPGLAGFAGGAADLDSVLLKGETAYFFKDGQYLAYDLGTQAVVGGPQVIDGAWPGLDRFAGGAREFDGAFRAASGDRAFVFKGDRYVRYDVGAGRADAHYPAYLSDSTWPGTGFWPADWHGLVEGEGAQAFVFKPGEYLVYDRGADRALQARPGSFHHGALAGLEDLYDGEWFEVASGAGSGVLQTQVLQGDVPPGARVAEVEIRFEHPVPGAKGDAYADNLSLTFLP
ncbi:alkaline phosphatase family protein [Stenotrophomonas sp. HITSZ_GD]|uniref:alkaline phosphatase family protein n=1 Tax=Stenotrophomonas sp. HITSZ_GD TaxID=3037248 RepID=UPI00240E016C|nr:alkaline phosphatase family protein [Stenotrophomonas sp. HITSZ_GD]MDG2525222.1 alkaline phosphatase family protein [Stenotrophomonas sp. HITSZ_GD]